VRFALKIGLQNYMEFVDIIVLNFFSVLICSLLTTPSVAHSIEHPEWMIKGAVVASRSLSRCTQERHENRPDSDYEDRNTENC
jgi:hypothetical protein